MMKRLILLSRYFLTPFKCYNEIIPGLWLGNLQSCYDTDFLIKSNITAIVSLYTPILESKKFTDMGITIYQLKISDNIGLHSNILMFRQFDSINNFINNNLKYGNVLIHCHYGWQRSASICTAFLMKKFNISKEKAIEIIRNKRKLALFPESSFDLALRLYERKLNLTL
jgi:protein-tyrosine phosphatase